MCHATSAIVVCSDGPEVAGHSRVVDPRDRRPHLRVPVEHLVADEARRCADVPGRVARSYHALTKALYESAQPYKDARCDARVELEGVEIEGGMCHATNQMFVWPSTSGSSSQAMGGRTFEWSSDSLQMKHVE